MLHGATWGSKGFAHVDTVTGRSISKASDAAMEAITRASAFGACHATARRAHGNVVARLV